MKNFSILLFIFLFSLVSTAKENLPESTMQDLQAFSKKTLVEKNDFEELKKNINILIKLDDEDPSRTAVMMLSESYNKHPALYEKAIRSVETKKNKKKLGEIRQILKNFSKKGNG